MLCRVGRQCLLFAFRSAWSYFESNTLTFGRGYLANALSGRPAVLIVRLPKCLELL